MSDIGALRRSAVAFTFGPGAIVDFRQDQALVSGIVSGLEEWDRNFGPAGIAHPQHAREDRLERRLGVQGFRLPPVLQQSDDSKRLVAVRFPRWQQCPKCDTIAPSSSNVWGQELNGAGLFCTNCTKGRQKVWAVPVRFIVACPHGHIDDFPWHWWVAHRTDCKNASGSHPLKLRSVGAGLAGLRVRCEACGAESTMEGAFGEATLKGLDCTGRRPWLANADEPGCQQSIRGLQRGATNVYYPITRSALSIPPWSDGLADAIGVYWAPLLSMPNPEHRRSFILTNAESGLADALALLEIDVEELCRRVEARIALRTPDDDDDLRVAEYRQFVAASASDRDFECRLEPVPPGLSPWLATIARVVRLREVRALTGFTRIHAPDSDESVRPAPLSVRKLQWLPAIEVRGEGVFLSLNREALCAWEQRPAVVDRCGGWAFAAKGIAGGLVPTPRFLLLHSLAHALMRQLTLDCGYSSASLRERLYVSEGGDGMAGVLIYTATTDADGTLGGLARQGAPQRLGRSLPAAIRSMEWCSSDPLCIDGLMAPHGGMPVASCHACTMAPETSCEHFNRFLDRALLVGSPKVPELGFFHDLLRRAR